MTHPTASVSPASAPRFDIYRLIHKGLRAFLSDTLMALGRLDSDDPIAITSVCGQIRSLLAFCQAHLDKEEHYVHPAMEQRSPGSSALTASEHRHHVEDIAALEHLTASLLAATAGPDRAVTAHALYLKLSVFVGENLIHMAQEETDNNAILWRTHSDADLMALEGRIVASIPPADQGPILRWMIPAATPAERLVFLNGVRAALPADAFAGVCALISAHLPASEAATLRAALAA